MKYPDFVLESPATSQRLAFEACFDSESGGDPSCGHYYVLTVRPTTRETVVRQNYTPSMTDIDPHEAQKGFAAELLRNLNHHVGHDGGWVVGFTHPPHAWQAFHVEGDNVWGRMLMGWLDEDGDWQFTVDTDLPFADVLEGGVDSYINLCIKAYKQWEDMLGKDARKELGLKSENMVKVGQSRDLVYG